MSAKAADDSTQARPPADRQITVEHGLSSRESEVLELVTRGLTNAEIAGRLSVSVHTVKFHLGSVYRKLGVSNRTEAATAALRRGGAPVVTGDQPSESASPRKEDGLGDAQLAQLRDLSPLDLPAEGGRASSPRRIQRLEPALALGAVRSGADPASLLAAFAALIGRYTGRDDICVAVSTAAEGRSRGIVPIVLDLAAAPTFGALTEQTGKRLDVVLRSEPLSHAQLAALTATDNGDRPALTQLRLDFDTEEAFGEDEDFDLALQVDREHRASLWFDAGIVDEEAAVRHLGHLETLLTAGAASPELPLRELPVLTDEERRQLLVDWNATTAPYPTCRSDELIAEQAVATPGRLAVVAAEASLTYDELDRRANQMAHVLQALGAGPGVLVGVCLERSVDLVVALLGVMKSGGAYVPIDPGFPADRQQFMLEDANVKVLVTQEELLPTLPHHTAEVVCIGRDARLLSAPATAPTTTATPEDVAYVIYTSGSTGRPKGVQVPHRALVNFLTTMAERPGLQEEDVLVAVTTLSFDIAGLELYLPLIRGARVVLASRETAGDPRRLAALLQDSSATVMQATPTTWRMLVDAGWKPARELRALCGGEALPAILAEQLLELGVDLWNMYGPTETTIWSTVRHVTPGSGGPTIGRPIANTTLYILDGNLEPVPIGVPGELYIGGDGLAHGYLERPELTAERFVPHPFDSTSGARIYRTGDLARYRRDGEIEFLGRLDHQVKVRGFRIELGEIETALARHPGVSAAVATTREERPGDVRLVAYVIPTEDAVVASELRQFLAETLPGYMVPSTIVSLGEFPLTPNGKIDRKSLPAPTFEREPDHAYVAPRTDLERQLVTIWEEVLDIQPIGVTDDFFDLGATSIVAARLFASIELKLRAKLPLAPVFQAPTIERLAKLLESDAGTQRWTSLVPIQPNGSRTPIFCVHGGAGTILHLQPLARRLGQEQPFYGLQARGLYGDVSPLRTVEQMSAHYVDELRDVQPEGPYDLAGYCFGGIVAFDMAQRLAAAGQEVRSLVMFNAPSPTWIRTYGGISGQPSRMATVAEQPQQPSRSSAQRVVGVLTSRKKLVHYLHHYWWRTKRALYPARFWLSSKLDRPLPEELREEYFLHLCAVAQNRYEPAHYAGEIAMFYGEGLYDDPAIGWNPLAESVVTYGVPGEHTRRNRDAMAEPKVGFVADRLREYLDAVRGDAGTLSEQPPLERVLHNAVKAPD